ncbi:phasin family protein [Arenibaculum pallidiluteum]|uniref:phasin family protein n=1 Tax=Arenibaculum pallidiluteum TaxID=2812559 RepID=UPI001A97A695|nr:phasin family protein [Arenibaculum pallidiluteum]
MAKNGPFFDIDMTKMMDVSKLLAEYKLPGVDMNVVLEAQRRNIEALTAANQVAFDGVQTVLRRQAEILRQTMEQASSMLNELMAAGTPEDKVAKQTEIVKQAFEKALSNMKELAEMVARSNTDAANLLSKRVSDSLDELKTAVQKAKK